MKTRSQKWYALIGIALMLTACSKDNVIRIEPITSIGIELRAESPLNSDGYAKASSKLPLEFTATVYIYFGEDTVARSSAQLAFIEQPLNEVHWGLGRLEVPTHTTITIRITFDNNGALWEGLSEPFSIQKGTEPYSVSITLASNEDDGNENGGNGNEPDFELTYGTATDIDGNVYVTLIFPTQEWLATNLISRSYRNGDPIATDLDNATWSSATEGAYSIFPNNEIPGLSSDDQVLEAYGVHYNWHAITDPRGLCPDGWDVPSNNDWNELIDFLQLVTGLDEGNIGNALKSCRQVDSPLGNECSTSTHPRWDSHSEHFGTDIYPLSAMPSGIRNAEGEYRNVGSHGYWWCTNQVNDTQAQYRQINHNGGFVYSYSNSKNLGLTVRCVRSIE